MMAALAVAGCSGASTETSSAGSAAVSPTDATSNSPAAADTDAAGITEPPREVQVELPTGPIRVDGDDAFVVTPGGVLYWHEDLFGAAAGEPVRLVGTAADNEIESIAGVVDGAIILGLCCAVPEGQVSATTGQAATSLTRGRRADLGREGTALVAVGGRDLAVVDLTAGTGTVRELPDGAGVVPLDVVWSGDSPIVLGDRDGELVLAFLDADELTLGETESTGLTVDQETYAEFAGLGPDGEVAVVHAPDLTTDVQLQAFDVDTLQPVDTLTRTLPAGVRSVRVRSAGDVIWVDDGTVWRTVDGVSEPLGGGATAVWFAAD
jgi:hypothetical protein